MMMRRSQSGRLCRDLFIVKAVRTAFIPNFGIFLAPARIDAVCPFDRKPA
jgi:hypothetical protein